MNPRTALERLDAVRPGSDDLSGPEMAGLADALAGDAELRAEFDRRRGWDREIASAIRDVPVPDGLKDRLLARLAMPEPASAPPRTSLSRRRLIMSLATLATGIAAGVVYWTAADSPSPVSVAEMRDAATELLSPRAADVPFNDDFDPRLPETWKTRLKVTAGPLGVLAEDGGPRAAAWRVRSRGRAGWLAVVVAVPVDRVESPPTADSISDRDYVANPKASGVRTVQWTQDGFVYVCCVTDPDLDTLIGELETVRFA